MSDTGSSSPNTSREGSIIDDGVTIQGNSGIDPKKTGEKEPHDDRDRQKSQERSDSKDGDEEKEEEPLSFKRTRFETSEEDALNGEMVEYARKHFNKYIKEKDLKGLCISITSKLKTRTEA